MQIMLSIGELHHNGYIIMLSLPDDPEKYLCFYLNSYMLRELSIEWLL